MPAVQDGTGLMKSVVAATVGVALMLSSVAHADGPEGTWLSQDGRTKVQIVNCSGKLCATVVWLGEPNDPATGQPKTDKHNPDPQKRNRPLLGLQVARGMTHSGPNVWSGKIYNADDGRTYKANLTLNGSGTAQVQGCVLMVLCKSHTWTRSN